MLNHAERGRSAVPVAASFVGDAKYLASADSKPFTVQKEETTTSYTGPTVIAQGNSVVLSGRLLEDGVAPISGRTLSLTLGSGPGSQSCVTGLTDGSGNGQCTVFERHRGAGPEPGRGELRRRRLLPPVRGREQERDRLRVPEPEASSSSATGRATAATSPVMYWGAQWASAESARRRRPAGLQGLRRLIRLGARPACGAAWTGLPRQ